MCIDNKYIFPFFFMCGKKKPVNRKFMEGDLDICVNYNKKCFKKYNIYNWTFKENYTSIHIIYTHIYTYIHIYIYIIFIICTICTIQSVIYI